MKVLRYMQDKPHRVWVTLVVVVGLVIAGVAIGVTTANRAAAERVAAEQAAAARAAEEQAAAEATARLASAKEDADRHVMEGEARYADSEPWAVQDDRASLRSALDDLIALRTDEDTTAEKLESATDDVAFATAAVGSPPAPLTLICGDLDTDVNFTSHRLVLNPDGSGQFADLWAAHLRCDYGMGGTSVQESVVVQTPLQQAAVAAAKDAGYGQYHDTDAEILYAVYEGCAGAGSGSYYGDLATLSASQAKEITVWLTLCPDHPDAEQWRAKAGAGQVQQDAEANGTRVAPGGTYAVPAQMTTGSFLAQNVTNCYWETRDTNGEIIDNNFVLAAPQVVANVTTDAVVFTSQGACGYWNRQ